MKTLWRPSDNFSPRRDGATPDLIVLHYTAMEDCAQALSTLRDPASQVSAHYLISPQGEVFHLVAEEDRAWHAGVGAWGEVRDVNSRSIGIELSNDGYSPFAAPLMDALDEVLAGIMERWSIPPERVIAHSDMAPGRKIDPGPRFDWQRLSLQGCGVWPTAGEGAAPDAKHFRALAERFGYTQECSDTSLLESLRLRFRPRAEGPLDARDMGVIADLADRWPVDGARPSA